MKRRRRPFLPPLFQSPRPLATPDRPESDPLRHTQQARERLDDLIEHLRADVKKVEDPQAKALFETAAETLGGLREAFADYEEGDEAAWEGQ